MGRNTTVRTFDLARPGQDLLRRGPKRGPKMTHFGGPREGSQEPWEGSGRPLDRSGPGPASTGPFDGLSSWVMGQYWPVLAKRAREGPGWVPGLLRPQNDPFLAIFGSKNGPKRGAPFETGPGQVKRDFGAFWPKRPQKRGPFLSQSGSKMGHFWVHF